MTIKLSDSEIRIGQASLWLATGQRDKERSAVPQLRERFGLSATEAVKAIREANLLWARVG